MRGRTLTLVMVLASVVSSSWTWAEEPAAPAPPIVGLPSLPSGAGGALLPPPPRLQLTWPIAPASFSFRGFEAGSSATGPLTAFEARSIWFQAGRLSLATLGSALPTAALDCSGLTCQPTLLRSIGVEARLHLFSAAVVRDAYAFTRYETQWSAGREPALASSSKKRASVVSVGVGGTLDL